MTSAEAGFGTWRWAAFALLVASSFTALAPTIVAPSVPALTAHFQGVPHAAYLARLVLTLPSLFTALAAPLAGWAVDRWGRKPLLLVGTALYALAGASGAVLDNLYAILAGRALLGIAVGATMTAATTLIGDYFSDRLRQRLYGYQVAFMTFGASLFILLGGGLADGLGWRGPFLVYLIAGPALPLFLRCLPEPARAPPASQAPDSAATDAVPRAVQAGMAGLVALIGVWFIVLYLLPVQAPYLIEALGYAPAWPSAVVLAVYTSAAAVTSIGFSRIEARTGPRRLFFYAFAGATAGFAAIAAAEGLVAILAGCVVIGLSLGAIMPNAMGWLARLAPAHRRGRAMGAATTAVFVGQFASPLVSQPIAAVWSLPTAFALAAVVCAGLAAGFGAWRVGRRLAGAAG